MLNRFNSNTKKLNKLFIQKNINNLLDLASITASLTGIVEPEKRYQSKTKTINKIYTGENINNLINLASVTASLDGVTEPDKPNQSKVKIDTNPITFVSNKNVIDEFHLNMLKFSSRNIMKSVNQIVKENYSNGESYLKKLIIYNVLLDYGTEEPNPENFEIFIDGLHIPGIFNIKQVGNNIEITLTDTWIIDDRVTGNEIKVFGKIKDL